MLDVAVREFVPELVPSVHAPTVAVPVASVAALPPTTEPPPVATNVTAMLGTGLPKLSVSLIEGGVVTAVPTVAFWLSPASALAVTGAPACAFAVNTNGGKP